MIDRREFLKQAGAGAAGLVLVPGTLSGLDGIPLPVAEPDGRALALAAIDAARSAGADYADARVARIVGRALRTREARVQDISVSETYGLGVRVLSDGSWGFAASRELGGDALGRVGRQAVAQARANRRLQLEPVELAPVEVYPDARYTTPIEIDPFGVAIEDQAELLLAANAAATRVPGARFASSSLSLHTEYTVFASTAGSVIEQTLYRTYPRVEVTAVSGDRSDFQSRWSTEVAPLAAGYEHVLASRIEEIAPRLAEEAVEKLSARPVEPGRYDLVLHPSHLFLTIHESIGHPTELDRALGYEANYAGTSFLAPPESVIGRFRYGPEFMQIMADRTQERALATTGWDHDGVAAREWPIVRDGIFVDYQTTRDQVAWIGQLTGRTGSHGCSYGQSWSDVQFQRMPNVSLLPGEDDASIEEVIAETGRGIYMVGRGSYSIDQQRYNFQFGSQAAYEIRDGRLTGMLKDVAYQHRTPDFWNSLDRLGGRSTYELGGTPSDGKGQPSQANAVSHGCPVARFRDIPVITTGR